MNDTTKSVVSVASLPRPIHHLQIDLIEGGWGRIVFFLSISAFAIFQLFFLLSHRTYFPHIQDTCTFYSLRETTSSHTYNNNINININNVCIARRPGLKGRAGIFFLFFLFFFKTCE